MSRKIDYASLYTLRKDGRYVATYTDDSGKHYVYDRDPERLWHKMNDPKEEQPCTFSEIADDWEEQHWETISYKTAESYTAPLRRLKEKFGTRYAEDITPQMITAYLASLGNRGYAKRTVQMHRDILHMIFNCGIVNGKVQSNPCDAIVLPKGLKTSVRVIPQDEAINAVRDNVGYEFGLFAYLCLYSGLRRGEALALRYEDIDREHKVIRVCKAVEFIGNNPHLKTPKTSAGIRDTVLLDVLAREIPNGTGYIFCRKDGGLLTKTQYRTKWKRYCEKIGYEITAHQLRHGFATILYEAGIADKDAQELLGHSSITLTRNVYTHIRQAHREETNKKLNDFLTTF